jgi:hypothetical protein
LLAVTDVFLPNEAEAISLSGAVDISAAAAHLGCRSHGWEFKLGASGALAVSGEQTVTAPAIPVQVVDTVGAGDSFDAGFLYGFLNGWTLEEPLDWHAPAARFPPPQPAVPLLNQPWKKRYSMYEQILSSGGLPSICSANPAVLREALRAADVRNVLIEFHLHTRSTSLAVTLA